MSTLSKIFWFTLGRGGVPVPEFLVVSRDGFAEVGVRTIKWFGKRGVENTFLSTGRGVLLSADFQRVGHLRHSFAGDRNERAGAVSHQNADGNDLFVDINFRIDRPQKAPYILQFVAKTDAELREKVFKTVARSRTRDFLARFRRTSSPGRRIGTRLLSSPKADCRRSSMVNGLILERISIMDYRFDPDYLRVITEKKVAEAKTLEVRAQMEAQREANKGFLTNPKGRSKR